MESSSNSKIELTACHFVGSRTNTFDFLESTHNRSCKCKKEVDGYEFPLNNRPLEAGCIRSHQWSHITGTLNTPNHIYYSLSTHSKDSKQIELDLTRTFPENSYFSSDTGADVLNRILNRISNYMPNPGYVQGMNYIVAGLLWHCSEAQAFWLFIKLLTDYKMSENFIDGLPGLLMHFDTIENYVKSLWPGFHEHLLNNSILTGMYVTDWCVTIFCNIIPLSKLSRFFTYFFEEGWVYFYKLSIEILDRLRKKCMKKGDRLDILQILKPFQLNLDPQQKFLESLTHSYERNNWSVILKSAKKRKLN